MRVGYLDDFELKPLIVGGMDPALKAEKFLGQESLVRALLNGDVEFALLDSVEAYLRREEGLETALMIGGMGYELVLNERGQLFKVGIHTGREAEKPKLGVDDFGSSLLIGGGLLSSRELSKWELVKLPTESLALACEHDLIQGYLKIRDRGVGNSSPIRRELALVVKSSGRNDVLEYYRSLIFMSLGSSQSSQAIGEGFKPWDGCGSVDGLFVPQPRWEGWVASRVKSRGGEASPNRSSFLLEVDPEACAVFAR